MSPKFKVAICGGGISGLCLAVALSKFADIEFHVYEAAERFKEIGAGVMIWTRTWTILELMGLAEEFSRIAHAPPDGSLGVGFDFRKSDQSAEGFRFHLVEVPHGCIRFHRADFLDVFVNSLPKGVTSFRKRLLSYTPTDNGITLLFHDGDKAICDLLVGCDGIKSVVRSQLFESLSGNDERNLRGFIDPVFTGITAYRGLISADRLPKNKDGSPHNAVERPMMYCGKSKASAPHVVSYSIAQGKIVNVITFASDRQKENSEYKGAWVSECSRQELLDCYSNWEPEVQTLLQFIEKPTKWALHHLKPLPTYVSANIALVGDSAHAMLPHQGAGAGQAIEDAYVLAQILGSSMCTRKTLAYALKAYEYVRLPMANDVLQGSRDSGLMYEFDYPGLGEHYAALGPVIQSQWDWVWASHPEEEVGKGIAHFRASLQQ
ncbi:FAD/NAD-binding domain-containing protein [Fomitiporia mediterranea MF3/22]|uniref:FAD/NAD-binding domain-containing protein n=1 Tax=Fomitiporia mediterranea (strain MF3/22) TaxID=694068 RepID=UPI00044099D5|nr:FAD/NAD-binding domain-containing protein [Fomitiporia mediterranea MF3/22]EJD03076.1 FAD/NAD-binding domain-containing protein [Fomitiporia mediterranea MF3/22]